MAAESRPARRALMGYEALIALRYLGSRRKSAFVSITSFFTAIGLTLGVAALTITLAVMNGFEANLRMRVLSLTPQVEVVRFGGLTDYQRAVARADRVPGVAGADPFIIGEAMLTSPTAASGVVVRGVDPSNPNSIVQLQNYVIAGNLGRLGQAQPAQTSLMGWIAIGQSLAKKLHTSVGQQVKIVSPIVSASGAAVTATSAPLGVGALFNSGVQFIDDNLIFMDLSEAQAFFGRPQRVDGIEIRLRDLSQTALVTARLRRVFPFPEYRVRNWIELNQAASAGFAMLKTVYSLVLTLLIGVAAFNLVAMLIMVVMEKRRDIAILMAMGATRGAIRRIFMLKGLVVGALGTAAGLALGAMGCDALARFHFIHLPRDIYGISTLPVAPSLAAFAWVAVAAMGLCLVATIYPARQASRQLPVEIIRWE
ncbi:MAG TPA: FtsX-like permease family protein [Candidatus Binataceae bacterium]|nr:FtsX-like permease family protein [Candidatus Binataceae bacterium]